MEQNGRVGLGGRVKEYRRGQDQRVQETRREKSLVRADAKGYSLNADDEWEL